jgi:AbrB family looped-hinge helix DNA binding protein
MRTTIDRAGRLVVPKRIRDRLGLRGGEQLEIEEEHGAIRIARAKRRVELLETEEGILTAKFDPPLPAATPEDVREVLERVRR